MTGAPAMRKSPAPRANADRADNNRNEPTFITSGPEPKENFAAIYLARRYGLALPVAQTIAALANLGRAFV